MNLRVLSLLPACLVLCAAALPRPALAGAEEDAVRQLVARYVDARERADPEATAALFTEDADQLVSSGEWRRGRAAVVAGSMASSRAGGRRTIAVESVRFLGPDVALADGRYEVAGQAGPGASRSMWTSLLARRTADGWRIAAIRNMLPAPPPPAAPSPSPAP
jgi:uncharacterized protein (TIGR02246 family)